MKMITILQLGRSLWTLVVLLGFSAVFCTECVTIALGMSTQEPSIHQVLTMSEILRLVIKIFESEVG